MEAHAVPLLAIFEKKSVLKFHYSSVNMFGVVINNGNHFGKISLESLWSTLKGERTHRFHFSWVQWYWIKSKPRTTHVEKRQVIDGQQRLTTLQIFLAAFRDFCRAQDCVDLANECDSFILNKGMMADPNVDKFKVWPTQVDRSQFADVIASNSRAELEINILCDIENTHENQMLGQGWSRRIFSFLIK